VTRARAAVGTVPAVAAVAAGVGTAAPEGPTATKICTVSTIAALGGNKNDTAGRLPQPAAAKASLSLHRNLLSSGVQREVLRHTLPVKTSVHGLPGGCTQAGDTASCKLGVALHNVGLSYGGRQRTCARTSAPGGSTSPATVDRLYHVPLTVRLTLGTSVAYTETTQSVRERALGDGLS
jgi:hypothetical protein